MTAGQLGGPIWQCSNNLLLGHTLIPSHIAQTYQSKFNVQQTKSTLPAPINLQGLCYLLPFEEQGPFGFL